jgi:hypothetical protein
MNRSTARWTTSFAAAALLALPLSSMAQTAPPETPPAAAAQSQQSAAPQEHLSKAKEALNSIQVASAPVQVKTRINELKQRVSKLERVAATSQPAGSATAGTAGAKSSVRWDSEVASIDRTLTQMLGPASATGTSGTAAAAASEKAAAAMNIDPEVRSKLIDFRTHITAFAAAMAGAPAPSAAPSASEPAGTSTAAQPPASTQPPATATGSMGTTTSTSAQPPTSATGTASSAEVMAQLPAGSASAQQANAEAAKQHLTAARNTLSELTQLPAAAQLTGDSRTQVTQLISNFNELITTNTDWPAAYAKLEANLNALLGSQTPDESSARTTASGTAGAVGTSGTIAALDPAIRAKLVEFRGHLEKFQQAAGGPKRSESAPESTGSTTAGSMTGSAGTAASASTAATQSTATQSATSQIAPSGRADHQEVLRLIQAIEAVLQSAGSPTAASTATGTTGSATSSTQGGMILTAAQAEQLKSHLNELKRIFNQK